MRESRECILAGSRRGGRRVRKAKKPEVAIGQLNDLPNDVSRSDEAANGKGRLVGSSRQWHSAWQGPEPTGETYPRYISRLNTEPSVEKTIASAEIQNPSDALEILAQVAGDAGTADRATSTAPASDMAEPVSSTSYGVAADHSLLSFPPFANGAMTLDMIGELVEM